MKRYQTLSLTWMLFLLLITIYPTIRVLVIGHRASETIAEHLFSLIPEFLTLAFAIVVFFLTETRPVLMLKQKNVNFSWPNAVVGLYIVFLVALGSIHFVSPIAFLHEIRMTFFPVIFYFIFRVLSNNETQRLLIILMWWLAGISFVANVFYLLSQNAFLKMYETFDIPTWEYIIPRLSFLIWSPVVFGSLMALGLLLSLLYVQKPLFRIFLAMIFSISLALTMSRGAIIAISVALLFSSILSKKIRIPSIVHLVVFAVMFFSLSFVLTKSIDLVTWTFQSSRQLTQGTSQETRDISYSQILHDLHHGITNPNDTNIFFTREKMLFGSGLGTAGHVGMKYYEKHGIPFYKATMDGYYLKIFVETGLVGLVFFFFCMGFLFIWFMRHFFKERNLTYLLPAMLLLFTLVQSIVSNTMDFYFYSFMFWAILGSFKSDVYE